MLFTQIAALVGSAAIVSASPFYRLFRRDGQASATTVSGYVGRPTTLSSTFPDGYIRASTFWIGSSCEGNNCAYVTTQLTESFPCVLCLHFLTTGVTTDSDGDDITYIGDVYVTTDERGGPVTVFDVTPLPQIKTFPAGYGALFTITENVATSCDDFSLCTTTTFPVA